MECSADNQLFAVSQQMYEHNPTDQDKLCKSQDEGEVWFK